MKSNIGNTVIETESFIKQAAALWSSTELDDLNEQEGGETGTHLD